MYEIHGLSISSNTTKTVFVAEELGVDYKFTELDLFKGEHKSQEHLDRHPLGKLPTLTIVGKEQTLFESNSICRYLAANEKSHLYPTSDDLIRCKIDQWLDFFTNHLGRWLNSYAFEKVAKVKFGLGEPNKEVEKEALGFLEQQMPVLEKQLNHSGYLVGDCVTIADLVGFAYMENAELGGVDLTPYPNVKNWYEKLKSRESVKRGYRKLGRGV